jgi:cyclase
MSSVSWTSPLLWRKRKTLVELVQRVAREINIPFTVGGGISSLGDVSALLHAGADKITINSAAVRNPELIDQLAAEFGSQCVVLAIDTNWLEESWRVYVHGGRTPTEKHTLTWAREAQERGVGEILLTSMIGDGTQEGFSVELTAAVADSLDIPVIASGGAGEDRTFH